MCLSGGQSNSPRLYECCHVNFTTDSVHLSLGMFCILQCRIFLIPTHRVSYSTVDAVYKALYTQDFHMNNLNKQQQQVAQIKSVNTFNTLHSFATFVGFQGNGRHFQQKAAEINLYWHLNILAIIN